MYCFSSSLPPIDKCPKLKPRKQFVQTQRVSSDNDHHNVCTNRLLYLVCILTRLRIASLIGQVDQLWQRDRASSIDDCKGWVNLRLYFWLKGYFSRHCDMTLFTLTYSIMSMFTFWMAPALYGKRLASGARKKVRWRIRTTGRRTRSTWTCSWLR